MIIAKYYLRALSFCITDKCNLNCYFCSRNATVGNNNFMSTEFICQYIDEALEFSDIKTVNLSGGEPFLHPQLEDILRLIHQKKLGIRINSNGLFFNDRTLEMLKKYEAKYFTISLDSSDKRIHDNIRGQKGAFEKTVQNLEKISKEGFQYFVKATVTKESVTTLFDLMKLVERVGATGFSIGRLVPVGRGKEHRNAMETIKQTYFDQIRLCSEYAKKSRLKLIIDEPLRYKCDVRSIEFLRNTQKIKSELWGGCTAGTAYLYLFMNGDCLACPGITLPAGNLNKLSLKDIWFNSPLLKDMRTRQNLKGECGTCSNKTICGGCRAYAQMTTGDVNGQDLFCTTI